MIFAVKMSLDNTYGCMNSNVIILIASFWQNLTFKIQVLAGNKLKICVGTSSEVSVTLVAHVLGTFFVCPMSYDHYQMLAYKL